MQLKSRSIVVGLDFSDLGDRAFQQAFELAASAPASELHAIFVMPVDVVDPLSGYDNSATTSPLRFEEGVAQLSKHVSSLLFNLGALHQSGMRVYSHFRLDVPFLGIIQLAEEVRAHFIVLGTQGRHGVARWLLGSVAEGVVRHATCPVLVIPPEGPMAALPKLEPSCSVCLQARTDSKGRELWCQEHGQQHSRRHTYHQRDHMSEDANPPATGQ